MSNKALLKSARDKLNKKDFSGAKDSAQRILDFEPLNYTAHVFLGLALLELGEKDRSEQVYRNAIELEPDQWLARQGLAKFYERTETWDKLVSCLRDLANAFCRANDATKLAETLQRLLEVRRTHGAKLEVVDTLLLFLPGSPFYPLLSTLPEPDATNPTSSTTFQTQTILHNSLPTLEEIVSTLEAEETARYTKEFNARRTRLGAPKPDQIRKDLDREICEASKLPELYNEILNHPKATDELRLSTEAKLLRYKQRHLISIPSSEPPAKARLLKELEELVQGAILLKRPDETTWNLYLDWQDYDDVADLDTAILSTYVDLFPESPLSEVLRGYFLLNNARILEAEREQEIDTHEAGLDALLDCPICDVLLAQRILSDAYLIIEDYENASTIAKQGLCRLDEIESASGNVLQRTRTGLQVVLLTSLVHLFPPRHHVQAMSLIDQVLQISSDNVETLMAKGFVLQGRKKWQEAKMCFDQVVSLAPDSSHVLRAQEESAWCESLLNGGHSAISNLQNVCRSLQSLQVENDLDIARCLWRIGQSYWNLDGSDRQHAYGNFIAALKKDPGFAAAFTSLGLYYADFASPPDPIRASKCFQKAFELDPRETVAAQRLAIGFANEQEWDLVEVIAKRTIEGEGGVDAGVKGAKEGEGPTNVWAWKALGVVELHNSNFSAAIQAFQVALRADPDDSHLWLRLGEAYSKAGRYAAAIKALERAQILNEHDWLPRYFIALAQQGMGMYNEAIRIYRDLLNEHPSELAIICSLAQAYLQLGLTELNSGFRSRAELSFLTTAQLALNIIDSHPGFREVAWKLITDTTYNLSRLSSYNDEIALGQVIEGIARLLPSPSEDLKEVIDLRGENQLVEGLGVLQITIRSAEYRIGLGTSKKPEHSAWYDLGASLQLLAIDHPKREQLVALSVKHLSKAVKQDPGSDRYWVSLGLAYFSSSPRASQHALIKALEIDNKNATSWATLGLLYLHHGDLQLAEEVFQRAQTLDPDCTMAWIGQALIAEEKGDNLHANALFIHATSLDEVVPEADYNTSNRLFRTPIDPLQPRTKILDDLLPSYYLLARYCSRRPQDAGGLHLYALVCERLGHVLLGRSLVQRAIEILEKVYEEFEDPVVERQFMIANATLGRLNLACGDPDASLPSFESVLALVQADDESKSILEAQARLGIGMAQLMLSDFESALATFQEAQRLADESGDGALKGQTSIALAQVLWSLNEVEFREAGKTELLRCISEADNNLGAVKALAAMGIISSDEGLVDAAVSEIVGLPPDQRVQLDSERNVDQLLVQYHLTRSELPQALQLAAKSVFSRPSDASSRNALASLLLKADNPERALALLTETKGNGVVDSKPYSLLLKGLAYARLGEFGKARRCAQRAIMLKPEDVEGWKVLAQIRQMEA